jgi:pimeloyl-ACP methyl ester carboxylesterase
MQVRDEQRGWPHKIVMAETGHLLHMEQPGEFNAHLVGFLEGAPE